METKSKIKKKIIGIAITLIVLLLLKAWFASDDRVEDIYFHRWYVWISSGLRHLTAFVPFSIGDLIYVAWIIGALFFLLKLCYKVIRFDWETAGYLAVKGVHGLLSLYLAFLLLWGFNYDRQSVARDMRLQTDTICTTGQLQQLADTLLQLANTEKLNTGDTIGVIRPDTGHTAIFRRAIAAYKEAARLYPALRYHPASVKPAMFGTWLNYIGTTGYLNPFTNEAQVNTTVPAVIQPFVVCHEIAHQLGYAPEEDANFVGYIAATSIPDSRFRYAAQFEMFLYSVRQLARRDTAAARTIWHRAVPGIKADYEGILRFYEKYQGPLDDYSALMYDQYLKANKQEKGIHSYSEVTGWLVAYFNIR